MGDPYADHCCLCATRCNYKCGAGPNRTNISASVDGRDGLRSGRIRERSPLDLLTQAIDGGRLHRKHSLQRIEDNRIALHDDSRDLLRYEDAYAVSGST